MSIRASSRSGPTWSPRRSSPDYALSSHVAPLGLAFYTGDGLPATYQRRRLRRRARQLGPPACSTATRSSSCPFADGKPSGKAEDVVTGFLNEQGEARGRPVGVALDKTGALLIADDVGNTVWRVTAAAAGQTGDAR